MALYKLTLVYNSQQAVIMWYTVQASNNNLLAVGLNADGDLGGWLHATEHLGQIQLYISIINHNFFTVEVEVDSKPRDFQIHSIITVFVQVNPIRYMWCDGKYDTLQYTPLNPLLRQLDN